MNLFATPTPDEWLFIGIIFFLVTVMIAMAELIRRLLNGNTEITRKFAHVTVGILMACSPLVFTSGIPPLLISFVAVAGTILANRFGVLESLHNTERPSYGTTLHPLAFFLLVVLLWDASPVILSLSLLILAIPDALSAIAGMHLPRTHVFPFSTDKKTVEGSTVMFVSTFLLLHIFLQIVEYPTDHSLLGISAVTALFVTAWELLSTKGFDNLTIPISTAFLLTVFLEPSQPYLPSQLFAAAAFAVTIGVTSYFLKFLSGSGSIAAAILAVIIYGLGGWIWTIPILTFFISSSLLSKVKRKSKRKFDPMFEKSDRRDAGQVAANGGVAGIILLVWYFFPGSDDLYVLYVASLAAVTADTWSTEIGTVVGGKPRSIATFRPVEIGTSGGVSIAGFIGGAIGGGIIALSATLADASLWHSGTMVNVVVSGIAGSLADSLLGGTVQAQFQSSDGIITEKLMINGVRTRLVRGFAWMTNDRVNWLCALTGSLTMYFLH